MGNYGLTYELTVCNPKILCFKIRRNFHVLELFFKTCIAFSLEFFSLCKENNSRTITPPQSMQTLLFYRS